MAEVKWIKLSTDLFNNRKIKQIRKLPEGDALIGVWLQLMCLAGEINHGGLIYFSKDIPYTEEMLANEFERPINIIKLAIATFERFGMVDLTDDIICVSNWEKYQNQDKLETIKEYNRIKKREYREKQKEKTMSLTCPGQVIGSPQTDIYSISNSSSSSFNKNEKKIKDKYKDVPAELIAPLKAFEDMRKKIKAPLTDKALELMLKKLNQLSGGDINTSIAILEQSIMNSWKGIFELKEENGKAGNPFKEKLIKEIEDEQKRGYSNNDGYKSGLSQLLQGPSGD